MDFSKLKTGPDVSTLELAKLTPGYVGADLHALAREASTCAVIRYVASRSHLTSLALYLCLQGARDHYTC